MLSIGMLSLICALTSGVFGFGADAPLGWTWEKGSFFFFLLLTAVAFIGSTVRRPSLLWEVIDDIQRKRFQYLRREHARRQIETPEEREHHLQGI